MVTRSASLPIEQTYLAKARLAVLAIGRLALLVAISSLRVSVVQLDEPYGGSRLAFGGARHHRDVTCDTPYE